MPYRFKTMLCHGHIVIVCICKVEIRSWSPKIKVAKQALINRVDNNVNT